MNSFLYLVVLYFLRWWFPKNQSQLSSVALRLASLQRRFKKAEVEYVNERQQVIYQSTTGRTVEQGPFTKIIWPTTRRVMFAEIRAPLEGW